MKVKRALVSVSDKKDLEPFVRGLMELGVEVISTGGTARSPAGSRSAHHRHLRRHRLSRDHGRTREDPASGHPRRHPGRPGAGPAHMKAIADLGIKPIDLVVVNLYPFEQTIAQRGVSEADAVENIDIGGPSMVRAAAKNFSGVGIVTDPADYDAVLGELKAEQRRAVAGDAARPGRQGLPSHRPLRLGHRQLVRGAGSGLPRAPHGRPGQGRGPALRREPAPAGLLVLGGRTRAAALTAALEQLHGRHAVVQQPARPRFGPALPGGVRSACLRDRQAQQSLRRGRGRDRGRGLREGLVLRPRLGLRRRDRRQPPGGRGRWPGCSPPTSSRCCGRPATPTRPSRSSR